MLGLEEMSVLSLAAESELALQVGKEDSPEKQLFREERLKPVFQRSLWPASRDCSFRLRSQAVRLRFQSPYYSRQALHTSSKATAPYSDFTYTSAARPVQRQQDSTSSPLANYTRTERPLQPAVTAGISFDLPGQRNKSVLERSVLKEKQRFLQQHQTVIKLAIRLKKRPENPRPVELPSLSRVPTLLKSPNPGRPLKLSHLKTI